MKTFKDYFELDSDSRDAIFEEFLNLGDTDILPLQVESACYNLAGIISVNLATDGFNLSKISKRDVAIYISSSRILHYYEPYLNKIAKYVRNHFAKQAFLADDYVYKY